VATKSKVKTLMVLKDILLTCTLRENGSEIGLSVEVGVNGLATLALG
jgi:hypothetical protein